MFVVCQPIDKFTFQVGTSRDLLSHSMLNEWEVDSQCTHHMDKYSSLFMRLNKFEESKIYVSNDFSLDVVG
jgi:hypothetical protein